MTKFVSTFLLLLAFANPAFAADVGAPNTVYRMGASGLRPAFGAIDLSQSVATTGVLARTKVSDGSVATKTTTYSITTSDNTIIGDTSGGAFTVTLPTAVGASGRSFLIKKSSTDSSVLTVATTSAQTIDGVTTFGIVAPGGYLQVQSDGSNWVIIGKYNPWRVDAILSGSNPDLGTSVSTSYKGIEDNSLSLTNSSGIGVVPAKIPCSSTNAPSGTTCSAGNESVGVNFDLPAGSSDVMACVIFSHNMDTQVTASDPNIADGFSIVETASNAQTVLQDALTHGQNSQGQGGASGSRAYLTRLQEFCGTISFSSSGNKTLRLMYKLSWAGNGTINANSLLADDASSLGRNIHWTVIPLR